MDRVYHVPHFERPGESLVALQYALGPGGKDFNQSVALRRCGIPVNPIGEIGYLAAATAVSKHGTHESIPSWSKLAF